MSFFKNWNLIIKTKLVPVNTIEAEGSRTLLKELKKGAASVTGLYTSHIQRQKLIGFVFLIYEILMLMDMLHAKPILITQKLITQNTFFLNIKFKKVMVFVVAIVYLVFLCFCVQCISKQQLTICFQLKN